MSQQAIKLLPWVTFNSKLKGLPGYITYNRVSCLEQPCSLIAVLSVQVQQLGLIGNFEMVQEQDQVLTLVHLSDRIQLGGHICRIVYVPPNKIEHESVQYFCSILREIMDIGIADINSSGINRSKGKQGNSNIKFVVVNNKDIYRAELRQSQIELGKKVETPLLPSIYSHFSLQTQAKKVNLYELCQSLERHKKVWQLLLGGEKSWVQLVISTLQYYKGQSWLSSDCQKVLQMREKGRMLSSIELEYVFQDLMACTWAQSSLHLIIGREIAQQLFRKVKVQNCLKMINFLKGLQQSFLQNECKTAQQIVLQKVQIEQTLKLYGISGQFAQLVVFPKEKQILLGQQQRLNHQIISLKQKIVEFERKLQIKIEQINQFKHQLSQYSCKFVHFLGQQKKIEEIQAQVSSLSHKNEQLLSQIQAHMILEKKYFVVKEQLEQKVAQQEKQNMGMLECLRQLTQESLSLHTTIEQQKISIEEMKQQLQKNSNIEMRAFRSIQNEAEIKTRLHRYQQYVKELKISLQSFKKLDYQKFNYMLAQNYEQHKKVQERLKAVQCQLTVALQSNDQLKQALQRQKNRMNYFQRFIRSNLENFPIPECSEQNSVTEREFQLVFD